jgi:hypothetical protein
MTKPLDGIREKIARAREDFQTIEGEVRAWFAGKLYPVIHYHDSLTGWHSVKPEPITELIPLRWPVVLGELIHDLRSALDHLITLLVIANGQTTNRGNQFPIYSYGRDATWTKSDWSQRRSHFRRCVSGMSSDDIAVIKSLQPYRRRRRARLPYIALETIAEFSNLDKHQTLPAVFTVTVPWQTYRVNVTAPPGTREVARRVPTGGTVTPIGETELFALQIDPPATSPRPFSGIRWSWATTASPICSRPPSRLGHPATLDGRREWLVCLRVNRIEWPASADRPGPARNE